MSLFKELKRRNVFRVGIAYAVAAWLLIQIADVMIDNIGAPDWVFRTLLLTLLIGFPITLILAWAFELTPEGIKRENEVDREASVTQKTGRKLDRTIIVVLAMAVGYLMIDKLVLSERDAGTDGQVAEESAREPSVAVLPFTNMSRDPDNEYFSDGLTDTLLHMLAQLPDLKVAARTSSFAFKGQNRPIPEIASELGVQHVLEGSVQQAGNQVRVTAQLVRADDGFHVWSQNYTRPMEDIFAIQDEIAADVARALDVSLLDGSSEVAGVATTDLNAYDSYLRGLEQQAIGSYTSLDEAERRYERALTLDPDFTDARLALVRNYFLKNMTGMISLAETRQSNIPLIQRELERNPDNPLVQAYECVLNGRFGGNIKTRSEVQQSIRRCEGLAARVPTESFIRANVAGGLYFGLEDLPASLALLDSGLQIDPLYSRLYMQKGHILLAEERFDEAEAAFLRGAEINPDSPIAYTALSRLEKARGNLSASLRWDLENMKSDPEDHEVPFQIAETLYDLELAEEARYWADRVNTMVPGSDMAQVLELRQAEATGDAERALKIAMNLIENDATDRFGVVYTAIFIYTNLMMQEGRSQEARDYLISLHPELADFSALPETRPLRTMQRNLIALMSGLVPPEERLQAWEELSAAYAETGFDILDAEIMQVWDPLIRGNIDEAVTAEIELRMSAPLSTALNRHKGGYADLYGPIDDDPRYEAARAERERQFLALREEVQSMMLEPEWNE